MIERGCRVDDLGSFIGIVTRERSSQENIPMCLLDLLM